MPAHGDAMKRRHRHSSPLTLLGLATAGAGLGACSQSSGSSSTSVSGVQSLLFIKRQTTTVQNGQPMVDVAGGNGQVLDYQQYVPGGSLDLLSPATADGTVTNLTTAFPQADFNGADVSFDATQAVFSMKTGQNDHYHIYTVQLAPGSDGAFEMHQKTAGAWDD